MGILKAVNYVVDPQLSASDQSNPYALQQRQQLINALKSQAVNAPELQSAGAVVPRQSWITPLVQALSGYAAGRMQKSENQYMQNMADKKAQASQQLIQSLYGQPQSPQPDNSAPQQSVQQSAPDSTVGGMLGVQNPVQQNAPQQQQDPYAAAKQKVATIVQGIQSGVIDPDLGKQLLTQAQKDATPPEDFTARPGDVRIDGRTGKTIVSIPDDGQDQSKKMAEYQLAISQGYKGTFVDFLSATRKQAPAATFGTPEGDLMASLAAQGITLPAGFRSKEQQHSMLAGLIRKYPGLSTDEIATKIHEGQIDFGSEKKETTTAAGIAGRTSVGENELIDFIPKALQANATVPRGNFVPFNKLKQLGEANISDPNLKALYGRTQAILNAYDVVAARGGTDQEKRAHNRQMLETADSPETYEVAAKIIEDEARIAKKAARKAMTPFSRRTDESPQKTKSGATVSNW